MTLIHQLVVSRSDGCLQTSGLGARAVDNMPTPAQLQETPQGQFSVVDLKDPRSIDWRRKLGNWLMRELAHKTSGSASGAIASDSKESASIASGPKVSGPTASGPAALNVDANDDQSMDTNSKFGVPHSELLKRDFILTDFPERYVLYESLRIMPPTPDGKRRERRDYYLYGHPYGRMRRYRGPHDFAPHLLWLATDPNLDRDNCSCKICTPDELVNAVDEMLLGPPGSGPGAAALKRKPGRPRKPDGTNDASEMESNPPAKKNGATLSKPTKSTAAKTVPPGSSFGDKTLTPSSALIIRHDQQRLDVDSTTIIYRPGELVWYQRNPTQNVALGLGVLTARKIRRSDKGNPEASYTVQPLSYPYHQLKAVAIPSADILRPWLAFSTPPLLHVALRQPGLTFDTIDWAMVREGKFGKGDPETDASIAAAHAIDLSYTPFQKLRVHRRGTLIERTFNGVFLGGEKLWRGDLVRIRDTAVSTVARITSIVETVNTGTGTADAVTLTGDVWTLRTRPASATANSPSTNNADLPRRLRDDLTFRNASAVPVRGEEFYYVKSQSATSWPLAQIKGRWYECRLFTTLGLDPNAYQDGLRRGLVAEVGSKINARGDASSVQILGNRKQTRIAAFSTAVPAALKVEGIPPDEASASA